ncbi:peptide chain release factor N(5)-glutamine methyltransferase [Marinobacterium sediminicola]|uniref:Release factor glutamine methyltransferase n=1 Tax=Marinobacterium sediminicola TaxID=518898 RepID=A0ABY1S178_9GAMM|nr:peptide chain release factor N(5)-glutamine methyltransferase [Marinobacterium sediminicola]ULG69748.1 peptide chain release factor N(5)-glutamine methyltransferase [Marinobacterium sediminicola]SMR75442.1 [protein release factor]-glutamine N5-methyltransferase [Marinobacterium sediminicola]
MIELSVAEALDRAAELTDVSDSPRADIEMLLCEVLDKPRSWLFTWPDKVLSAEQQMRFEQLLMRRVQGTPIAHLLGYRDFWTLRLKVSPDTLIPRPDTETLVEQALALLPDQPARVADLGTGTGAIALALASERPQWQLVATDLHPGAVSLARENAQACGLSNVEIRQGSWCEPLSGHFDMIVSNPPYIDPDDPHLDQGDVRFEPLSALTAEEKGMADIRTIAEQARALLQPGGWLLFEHGYDQGELVRHLLQALGYVQVCTHRDLGDNDRVTLGYWQGESDAQ